MTNDTQIDRERATVRPRAAAFSAGGIKAANGECLPVSPVLEEATLIPEEGSASGSAS